MPFLSAGSGGCGGASYLSLQSGAGGTSSSIASGSSPLGSPNFTQQQQQGSFASSSSGSSSGLPSAALTLPLAGGSASPNTGVVSSPRFGPDGFPLSLGGILEEEESEGEDESEAALDDEAGSEKAVRRASQQVSLPPARFGRFTGNNSPRLPAAAGPGWQAAPPPPPPPPPLPSAAGPRLTNGANGRNGSSGARSEEDRLRSFAFGNAASSAGGRFPSSPLAGAAFVHSPPLLAQGGTDDGVSPATFAGPAPSFGDEQDEVDETALPPAISDDKPRDETTRFRAFAFPRGTVAAPRPPAAAAAAAAAVVTEAADETSPVAESAGEWETLDEDAAAAVPADDLEKTPNPPQPSTFSSLPREGRAAPIASPPLSTKKALRPLTLAAGGSPQLVTSPPASGTSPTGRRAGLRPLSLSLASSSSSSTPSRNRANTSFGGGGSDSSFGAGSPPPTVSPAGRYGGLGYGRPSAVGGSGSRSNLSLSSSTSSVSSATSSFAPFNGGGRSNSVSSWTPSPGRPQQQQQQAAVNGEKRRSSISYGKSPSPSPGGATPPGSSSGAGGGKRSLAKCPPATTTRPLSYLSGSSSSRRVLADVGEDQEEHAAASAAAAAEDDDGRSVTSPFSHEDDPFLHRGGQPFSLARGPGSSLSEDVVSAGGSSPVASAEEQRLRQQLESVESERDALAEDVEGWRSRCKLLEEKLAEEKRIAVVERDLSRERIRKRASSALSLSLCAWLTSFLPVCSRRPPREPDARRKHLGRPLDGPDPARDRDARPDLFARVLARAVRRDAQAGRGELAGRAR